MHDPRLAERACEKKIDPFGASNVLDDVDVARERDQGTRRRGLAAGSGSTIDLAALRWIAGTGRHTVGELAQHLGMSARQLHRLCVKQFGLSPEKWLHSERLHAAKQLLLSAASIKETALSLGFRPSQFSRDFRLHFGCSPSEWIAQAQQIAVHERPTNER
jgi:AraC-like DNA-binding protein